ncbi:MAG: FN3 associated domain-containing protein [Labilithrix sp.]
MRALVVALLTALAVLFVACTETKTTQAGLGLIISTNLTTPADLDSVELEVRQETEPGKYDSVLISNRFGIPGEAQLPATFTIGAGASPRQNAYIRLTGRRGEQALVLREVKIQIPKNRVAALTLVLAASCVNHLKVDDEGAAQTDCANVEESCQPETGQCGPTLLDVNTLPDFDPVAQLAEAGALPIVKLDSGGGGGETPPDAGDFDSGPPKSTAKEISKLTISNVEGSIVGDLITVQLPPNADLGSLVPNITFTGTAISPPSGTPQSFKTPVKYLVTAEDGSTRQYTVVVQITGTGAKSIKAFELPAGSTVIDGTNITITVPNGTDVTLLAPNITFEGKTISPAPGAPQNFTNPFPYKVTAYDDTTVIYIVKVIVAAASDKDITELSIEGTKGTIAGTNISVVVPGGTNLAALKPKVVITGKSVSPASGQTQSFVSPAKYTVTAADGSTKVYTVTVTALARTSKDITSFVINGVSGSIDGTNITLVLPPNTNLTVLAPTITHTGASITPASLAPQDFTAPRQYVVTAEDGTKQTYSATVTAAPGSNQKDITDFVVNGVHGSITANNVTVVLSGPSNLIGLTPTIAVSPSATVSPPSGSAQSFNAGPVTYVVTAENGSTKTYSVSVAQPTVAKPEFNPPSPKSQDTPFDVTISSSTPGATIRYTTDGSLPDGSSPAGTTVHIASANVVVKAIAIAAGYQSNYSDPGFYSLTVAPVVFTPPSGEPFNRFDLALGTSTSGAIICYTTSFAAPPSCNASGCTGGSLTYSSPFLDLNSPGQGVTRPYAAIACKSGYASSDVVSSVYQWRVYAPVYSPSGGNQPPGTSVVVVTATHHEDLHPVSMYYTADGTDPVCGAVGTPVTDNVYTFTLPLHATTTFKFVGCRNDYLPSLVSVATFTVP